MQARWDQLIILEKVSLRIMEVLEPSYSLLKAWPSHILVLTAVHVQGSLNGGWPGEAKMPYSDVNTDFIVMESMEAVHPCFQRSKHPLVEAVSCVQHRKAINIGHAHKSTFAIYYMDFQ